MGWGDGGGLMECNIGKCRELEETGKGWDDGGVGWGGGEWSRCRGCWIRGSL